MEISPAMESRLRAFFKRFNQLMLLFWRLGLGFFINSWPDVGGQIMVVTHIGRKTGARRQTPVNYACVDDDLYCLAGFGKASDWYRNILKNPAVEVWLPDGWWQGKAEDASAYPQRIELMRKVLIASGFAAWIFGMRPRQMSDEEIAAATAEYKLIRIRRTTPCTGKGGPGELTWVWPALVMVLLPLAFRKHK